MDKLPEKDRFVNEKEDADKVVEKADRRAIIGPSPSARWYVLVENETVIRWN